MATGAKFGAEPEPDRGDYRLKSAQNQKKFAGNAPILPPWLGTTRDFKNGQRGPSTSTALLLRAGASIFATTGFCSPAVLAYSSLH